MTGPFDDVPRSELRRAQKNADDDGELAELLVAAKYQVTHDNDTTNWYDCRNRDTGTKYEVKSCELRVGDEYPADGRFRLWRAQLRSLIHSRAGLEDGSTWVVFVLFDEDQPIDLRRMHAGTVWDLVDETVGWGPSGHQEWNQQAKLPIDEVFPEHE